MKADEVMGKRANVATLCTDFISKSLEEAVRNGDTDAEEVTDAPELRQAEENLKKVLRQTSPLEMLTVNGGV